jgi:hypothetical protein
VQLHRHILRPRGLLPNCYQAGPSAPANPCPGAKSDDGRYWLEGCEGWLGSANLDISCDRVRTRDDTIGMAANLLPRLRPNRGDTTRGPPHESKRPRTHSPRFAPRS